jgi:hypothetical protein
MYVTDTPYISKGFEKKTVTTLDSIDFKGKTAVIHNIGPDKLYYCAGDLTATADAPELTAGEKTFPRTGKLSILSAGSSVLKIEYIDQVG